MKFRGIIKLPSHKQFNYIPRYYDKEKEEREEREERRKARARTLGIEEKEVQNNPGSSLRKGSMRGHYHKKEDSKRTSTVRLVIIIFILLVVAYYLLS